MLVIPVCRPLAWLADGWRDLRYAPGVSLVHGILVAVGGWIIAAISLLWVPLLPGAFSGFVLVAPILATGLYEMSRCRERGKPGDMVCALDAWRRGTRPLVWLGLGLAIAGTAWVLVSAVLVALFVTAPITGWEAFIRHVILSQGSNLFPVWMTLGAIGRLARLRRHGRLGAAAPRPRHGPAGPPCRPACGSWPRTRSRWPCGRRSSCWPPRFRWPRRCWASSITIPVIGHATWHAYRETVDARELPARE